MNIWNPYTHWSEQQTTIIKDNIGDLQRLQNQAEINRIAKNAIQTQNFNKAWQNAIAAAEAAKDTSISIPNPDYNLINKHKLITLV